MSLFGAGAQQKEAPTYHNRNCCFGLEIVPNFVNDHFISQIIDQILKSKAIIDIGRITSPTDNQAKMVENIT
ncbi:MAG: hypothetical protein V3T90_04265 [Anaerolineae bacterium]